MGSEVEIRCRLIEDHRVAHRERKRRIGVPAAFRDDHQFRILVEVARDDVIDAVLRRLAAVAYGENRLRIAEDEADKIGVVNVQVEERRTR